MPPIDEFPRTGQTNGTRRKPRARRATAREDDRPRGFAPDRMRRLWNDIDRSRDNLGLGPEAAAASSSWSIGAVVSYAAGVATGAVGAVLDTLSAPVRVLTAPTRTIGAIMPCVRRLPIVGGLFE